MRHNIKIVGLAVLGIALGLVGCSGGGSGAASQSDSSDTTLLGKLEQQLAALPIDSINYALGYVQGRQLHEFELRIAEKPLLQGLRDGLAGKTTMPEERTSELLRRYVQIYSQVRSERNARRSELWLDSVASVEGVERTESGLAYKIITPGTGKTVNDSSYVQVHIAVRDMRGGELENTRKGEPVTFCLSQGLRCWVEGLKYIREGGSIELYSPASLAYGVYGTSGVAPNSAMRFDIDLLKILTKEEYEAKSHETQAGR